MAATLCFIFQSSGSLKHSGGQLLIKCLRIKGNNQCKRKNRGNLVMGFMQKDLYLGLCCVGL